MELRYYQREAIDAVVNYWNNGGGNPLVDMATGTGKSVVIGTLVRELIAAYPAVRVLMLTHVKELVAQNMQALLRVYPQASAGIYSAGLGKRDAHHRITFASIQSVYNKAAKLGPRDLVLIDEAHLVPSKGEGMYRTLLDNLRMSVPDLRVAGLTATPFRLGEGRLDDGDGRMFDETVYSYGIAQGISDKYLSLLISPDGLHEIDVSGVAKRGGEFVPDQLEAAADRITIEACREIAERGADRKSWLIFCSGVNHAQHTRDVLRSMGISCEMVTGDTPSGERDSIIRRFKSGQIRALTNANVLTTGFDAPSVDLIAMLRPTLSTSLYIQIVGRGTRLANGKENCLVLDFAGNIRRHGPVDTVVVEKGSKGTGKAEVGDVRAKGCPSCQSLVGLATRTCQHCGHEWTVEEVAKHEAKADKSVSILSTEKIPPLEAKVTSWEFAEHLGPSGAYSLRVTYWCGLNNYREWLHFNSVGSLGQQAQQWWHRHRGRLPYPKSTNEALSRVGELAMPSTLHVREERINSRKSYWRIIKRFFDDAG